MKKQKRHNLVYVAAWLLILAFFAWTANLLLNVQSDWAQSNEVTRIDRDVHGLLAPWRNLNRPGNDVLENYEVERQTRAFKRYLGEYAAARTALEAHRTAEVPMTEFYVGMDEIAATVETLASRVLQLAGAREGLRLSGAGLDSIRQAETEAATTMARMDQGFQVGMDLIVSMDERLDARLLELVASRRASIRSLYLILLVALLSSALSLVLLRRIATQGEALRSGAERINAIVNNVVDGIISVDEDGNIESFNRTAEQMFGCEDRQIVGHPFIDLIDPESLEQYKEITLGHDESEYLGRRLDTSEFPMELAATRIEVDGRPLLVYIVRDITERKHAEERLRLAASVFENTTEGILITDENGTIQSINPAFTAMTGFTAEEATGENPRILHSGEQSADFYKDMWESITTSGHWQGELNNRRKNGEIYPQWLNINAIKDARGRVTNYVGVTFDITELKASERLKDEFIATVSHELRTPLTSIHGSLRLLGGGVAGELSAESAKLVKIAANNSQRLVRLIDDILSIAKIEAEKMKFLLQPLAIDDVIGRAIEANQDFAQQYDVRLQAHAGIREARVLADNDRLMQVLTNLLSNAVKHSPAGGEVQVGVQRQNGYWRISVVDNGPGIPDSFRDKVFSRFAQADGTDRRKGGGTGLGLSICKAIIDRLGGRIGFESEAGVRTSFYFDLPVMQRQAMADVVVSG